MTAIDEHGHTLEQPAETPAVDPVTAPADEPDTVTPPSGPGTDDDQGDLEQEETSGVTGFDVEAFVKALPDGVVLCPICLGLGGVLEEPPFDPHAFPCPTCRGWGRVRTGSMVSDQVERPCIECQGRGWVDQATVRAELPPPSPPRSDGGTPRDDKGRTPDHPDFDWGSVTHAPASLRA